MRLARLVAAGLVLGAAIGFLGALLRPRPVHPRPAARTAEPTTDRAAEPEPPPADVQTGRIEDPVSAGVR